MLTVTNAECYKYIGQGQYAECHYAECRGADYGASVLFAKMAINPLEHSFQQKQVRNGDQNDLSKLCFL